MTATLAENTQAAPEEAFWLQASQQTSRPADFSKEKVVAQQEFDIELVYAHRVFPVEGASALKAKNPLRLGYNDKEGTLEVIGWDLRVDLNGARDLPRLIARRFLELYSKLWTTGLTSHEDKRFGVICDQIDYRAFTRSRELPKYREAKLLKKVPCYLEFLSLKSVHIDASLLPKLHVLNDGDLFGAWFATDSSGDIVDIRNVTLLEDANIELPAEDETDTSKNIEFPKSLEPLLPKP